MSLPFLILETGEPVAPLRRRGSFPHWIRVAAGLSREDAEIIDVRAVTPSTRRGHAGILVTGSAAMVSDREPWSEATAEWLRDAVAEGAHVFGICYGHQLIAHALGGEVGDNPAGREMGTVEVSLAEAVSADPLLEDAPTRFLAQSTHLQTVISPPPGAEVLARTAQDAHAMLRFGENAWGVQFHPEFSARHMHGYIRARAPALAAEGRDPSAMQRSIRATPVARGILRQFVRRASRAVG